MQASDKSKNDSVPEIVSDDEGETSDDQSEGSPTNLKSKVKSILGFGEEDSDNPSPKVSDSETETEGDDSEGEGEGEAEEKPNLKIGFSKLLGSLKDAVSGIVGDTGSAAVEAEQANIDKPGRRKGKSVASAAAASKTSSRKKKLRGVQPTEEELAYNSDDDEQDGDGNTGKGDSDDDCGGDSDGGCL